MRKGKIGNKNKYGTVSLPMPIIEAVKENIEGTGVSSVSAYVTFILRQIFSSPNKNKDGEVLDRKTEDEIKERLKISAIYNT